MRYDRPLLDKAGDWPMDLSKGQRTGWEARRCSFVHRPGCFQAYKRGFPPRVMDKSGYFRFKGRVQGV